MKLQEAPGGPWKPQEATGSSRRPEEAQESSGKIQDPPGGTAGIQEATGSSRRFQEAPGGSTELQEASSRQIADTSGRWRGILTAAHCRALLILAPCFKTAVPQTQARHPAPHHSLLGCRLQSHSPGILCALSWKNARRCVWVLAYKTSRPRILHLICLFELRFFFQ